MMTRLDFRNHHEREAVRLGALMAVAPTPALKARFLEEAEKQNGT
jgi:hypothetical protein